jgi:hypothetical protein
VRGLILASSISDNTPNGYYWTFLFPMLLFIAIAVVLYLLFSRPHQRVPARGIRLPARSDVLGPDAARSAAVAGGLSTAGGGGSVESHLEPHGAHLVASMGAEPADTTVEDTGPAVDDGEQAEGDAASAGDAESSE